MPNDDNHTCPHSTHCKCNTGGIPKGRVSKLGENTFDAVPACHQDVRHFIQFNRGVITERELLEKLANQ